MKLRWLLLLAMITALSCSSRDAADTRLRVICTTGMIGSLAEQIAGDEARVTCLMGAGVDPHQYKASARDLIRLAEADLVIYNGLHLEARLGKVLEKLTHARSLAVAESLPGVELIYHGGQHPDPHLWFDVKAWSAVAMRIGQALAAQDSLHASLYLQRAEALEQTLLELDTEISDMLDRVPVEARILITAHDAFAYFGRRYAFEVRGLQGISTVTEPSASAIRQLRDLIVSRKVPAVFIESSVPVRTIQSLQQAVAAEGHELTIGEALFSDAPGSRDTPEGSYQGMVLHNARAIARALGEKR
jgi:manganese/zinc/iron transport system substrate-binding protein